MCKQHETRILAASIIQISGFAYLKSYTKITFYTKCCNVTY